MSSVFLTILKMSYTACFVIIAVCIMRLIIRKAPKKYAFLLWSVVGFRLIIPVSWHSIFSIFSFLFPITAGSDTGGMVVSGSNAGTVMPDVSFQISNTSGLSDGMPLIVAMNHAGLIPTLTRIGTVVWCAGVLLMLLYGILNYLRMNRQLETSIRLKENIYQSDRIRSPFIFGILSPRIFLPFGLAEETLQYVLAHERCHIRRKDHIIKLAAFLMLALHWFNPLCWLAFYLMSRDMEMSCDEKVLSDGNGTGSIAASYSTALLSFASASGYAISGPLAFGETSVKRRVKNILAWKKTKAGVAIVVVCLCIATIFTCAANPVKEDTTAYAEAAVQNNENRSSELYTSIKERLAYTGFDDSQIDLIYQDLKEDKELQKCFFEVEEMNKVEAGINDAGLTYGPDMYHTDLIGATSSEGTDGYIYRKELDPPDFTSPDEALAWQEEIAREYPEGYPVPVYEKDGVTQIGIFYMR